MIRYARDFLVAEMLAQVVGRRVDTVVVQDTVWLLDTVRVVDTVNVTEQWSLSNPSTWTVVIAGTGIIAAGMWKLGVALSRLRASRRAVHAQIHATATVLRRNLQAAVGSTQPQPNDLWTWAHECQKGLNTEEQQFNRLLELAADAKPKVGKLIRPARDQFYVAAAIINGHEAGGQAQIQRDGPEAWRVLGECVADLSDVLALTGG